jgi:hypothetical protein
MLEKRVLSKLGEPIRYSPTLEGSMKDLIAAVKAQGFEGAGRKAAGQQV